ncbi:MAG: hypothetical protein FJY77_00165 [Candidatus Altiarchaeales archaeon]|nr:hypothetical protein [Candidatus Altiarchaeales archaeon]
MGDWVLHIALLTSVVGLVLLTVSSEYLEPPYSEVGSINTGFVGKNVHLKGEVTSIHKFKGGSLLVKVSGQNSSIDVFVPYAVASQVNLDDAPGRAVDLIGAVEVYNGRLEVVVDKESNVRLIEDDG